MLLVYEGPVPLAENHEGVHGPADTVSPPRLGGRSRRCRGVGGRLSLVVKDVLVRKVQPRRLRDIGFLKTEKNLLFMYWYYEYGLLCQLGLRLS